MDCYQYYACLAVYGLFKYYSIGYKVLWIQGIKGRKGRKVIIPILTVAIPTPVLAISISTPVLITLTVAITAPITIILLTHKILRSQRTINLKTNIVMIKSTIK